MKRLRLTYQADKSKHVSVSHIHETAATTVSVTFDTTEALRTRPLCQCGQPFDFGDVAVLDWGERVSTRRTTCENFPWHVECYKNYTGSFDPSEYVQRSCRGCGLPMWVRRYQLVSEDDGPRLYRRERVQPVTCCSRACYLWAWRHQQQKAPLATNCVECGSEFHPKRADARFCSPTCRKRDSRRQKQR